MGFFQSLKKGRRLKKVSRQLTKRIDITDVYKLTSSEEKESALNELVDICYSDEYVKMVMDDYNKDGQTIKELYSKLTLIGAGQYAGGHYVAASSLVFPLTLKFLLEHYNNDTFSINDWDNYNSSLFIAHRLIEYFEKGEVGEVTY